VETGKELHSYTTKEVLNKVLSNTGSTISATAVPITQELLNLVLNNAGDRLQVDIVVAPGSYIHFGTETVTGTWDDGTWRLGTATLGGDFVLELKTSGSWVEKWAREA